MATKTKVQKSQPAKGNTVPQPTDQEIAERLKKIDANISNLSLLVNGANSIQNKKIKDLNGSIEKLLKAVNVDFEEAVRIAEKGTNPSSEIVSFTKDTSGYKKLLIHTFNQFKVITLETELTYLSRFLDFWNKSAKKLFQKIKNVKSLNISEFSETASGFRMNDGSSYVSDETMNQFVTQLYSAISQGSVSASDAITQFTSANPVLAQEMGSILTVLRNLTGAAEKETAIYGVAPEDVSEKRLENQVGLYTAHKTLSEMYGSSVVFDADQNKKIDSQIAKIKKIIGKQSLSVSFGNTTEILDASNIESLKTLFEQNRNNIFDISYVNSESGESFGSQDMTQAAIQRYRNIQKERKAISTKRDMGTFLESIVIYHNPKKKGIKNPEKIFEKEKNALSALFYAAYVNLPKFRQETYDHLGFDKSVIGSEALAVARMQLVRVIERIIAEKVISAESQITTADATYKRTRQKNLFFKGDPEDIINKILFEISPTEFPADWTLAFSMAQQVNVKIDGKNYRLETNQGSGFFVDPDLNPNDKKIAQGDHIIAHNRAGATIPRNLLALSSSLNQSKQDAETGRDQILQTVITYRRLFGSSSEMDWIDNYHKSANIIGVNQVKDQVSSANIEAARKKIKLPSDEIKLFDNDVQLFNKVVKTSNNFYAEFDKVYNLYVSEYKNIQSAFDAASSELRQASNRIRDSFRIALEGKDLQSGEFSQLAEDITSECNDLINLIAKTSSNRKVLIDLRRRYKSISGAVNKMKAEAKANRKDYNESLLKLRGGIDIELDNYENLIKSTRDKALTHLSNLLSAYGDSFQQLSYDLKKGQQKFRGARVGNKIQKSKLAKPKKIEDSYLSVNIVEYEKLKVQWATASNEYSAMEASIFKRDNFNKTLKGIEQALESLIDANQFILFSEYFE